MNIPASKFSLTSFVLFLALLALGSAANAQTALSFSKSFSPATIGPGSVSTLTFTIVNNTSSGVRNLDFTDNLPAAVTIAAPANATVTDCSSGTVSAPDGGGTISFSGGGVGVGGTCTITVDVTSSTVGTHTNVSGDLTSDLGSHGSASADLTVATDRPGFSKSFDPSTVSLGGGSTLTLTIDNSANVSSVNNASFTDNLPSGMEIGSPANEAIGAGCDGGTLSAPAGGTVISYSNFTPLASIAAGATCTLTIDVVGNALGALGNTTGDLSTSAGSSGKAAAVLTVTAEQIALSKSFTDDPVAPGDTVTLEFTIFNRDRRNPATNIAFSDDLSAMGIPGLAATGLPISACGGTVADNAGTIELSGGSLGPEGSCTFNVTLTVPSTAASGSYTNTTSAISADVDGDTVTGNAASDDLFVEPGPTLTKTFNGDPVTAGDTVDLAFTITNTASSTATDIAFEDVFVEELPTASVVPADGSACGAGADFEYTPLIPVPQGSGIPAKLVVSGASLSAGASCTFSITLDVSTGASTGTYANTTSEITATVNGETVTGSPASDSFAVIAAPDIQKTFLDDPVAPGGTVTLEFSLDYDEDAPADATAIAFTDDLTAALSGLTAVGLPAANVCGPGSEIDGTTNLSFTGGSLAPGESCSFSVTLTVPASAAAGTYPNTTSNIVASVNGLEVTGQAATDDFLVAGLTLTKEFTDDPVLPGGTVTLEFTIANSANAPPASDIFFVDDLDDVIDNMTATLPPTPDPPCGAGSALTGLAGNTLLQLQGGSLGPGEFCTFNVTLQVPAGAEDDVYFNLTSSFSATIDGATIALANAGDSLTVIGTVLSLTKEFTDDPVEPGDPVTLRFTLENLSDTLAITGVAFSDDLDAALFGLVATGLPIAACGGNVSGTDTIVFSGGSLAPSETCSFDITLAVPGTAELGTVAVNLTSEVTGTAGGLGVTGDPATDELELAFIAFSKAFSEESVEPGATVTLTFNVTNLSDDVSLFGLSFSDDLDAAIPGLAATGGPTPDPPCGAGSLLTGTAFLSVTGIELLPGGSCTFSVELQVPGTAEPGDYVNETSELRDPTQGPVAAPATDELTVISVEDTDGDGVPDDADVCPGTVIPEGVPTVELGVNRYALVDDDFIFDTRLPPGQDDDSSDDDSSDDDSSDDDSSDDGSSDDGSSDDGSSDDNSSDDSSSDDNSSDDDSSDDDGDGGGDIVPSEFTTTDTRGCSCEQIIDALHLGQGHRKFGCSRGVMLDWINQVTPVFVSGFESG